MSKSVKGDPKEDAKAKKAFKVIDDTFYASNQFKAGNLKNYDMPTLKKLVKYHLDFAQALPYMIFRLEQSDGAQKAQINKLEERVAKLEALLTNKTVTSNKKPAKKVSKINKIKVVPPQSQTVTANTATTVTNV